MKFKKILKRFVQFILIVAFIGAAGFFVWLLDKTKPMAEEKERVEVKPLVETMSVRFQTVEVEVPSQGIVQARKRTMLASELSGKVDWISDKFVVGGTFAKDEVILRINKATYDAALAEARASLVEAEVNLTNEEARAEQARRDWERMGRGKPSALTLREPQIRSARSRITAAEAAVLKAERDLERTVITSPFDATVVAKSTEVGNYLAPGSMIGEFFQTSPLEIRLSLPIDELRFLNRAPEGEWIGDITLSTTVGSELVQWSARIDRTEGQVDQRSRSIYLVSEIDPAAKGSKILALQPGLYLDAAIRGRSFDRVVKVPANAFLDLNRVVLVDEEGKLEFRSVTVLRRDKGFVYVSEGLNEDEQLCLTELATMIEGTKVDVRALPGENSKTL